MSPFFRSFIPSSRGYHRFCGSYAVDLWLLLGLIVFSIIIHYGRIGASVEGIALATDPAMYCSIIAAGMMPEAFKGDVLLSQPAILDIYRLIHFPLIEWLSVDGNVGLGYLRLTGLHVFLHYCGFYLLGRMLLGARWKALVFTILMGMTYWIPWGTYWGGGYLDYTPRTSFAALCGFLLCAVLAVLDKPRWWPIVLFAAGGLVYVHSISAPAVLASLWLGFAAARPVGVTWKRHSLWMLFTGLCGLIPLVPYALHFFSPGLSLSAADTQVFKDLVLLRFDREFTFYREGIRDFLLQYTMVGVFPLAAAAVAAICAWGTKQEKRFAVQVGMWCLGPVVVTGLFIVDQSLAAMRQAPPMQFDLIRTLRFVPFFAICTMFLGLNAVVRRTQQGGRRLRFLGAFLYFGVSVGLFIGSSSNLVRTSMAYYWNNADPQRYEQAYHKTLQRKQMLDALGEHTPPSARIFAPFEDEAVRYYAHRSLVFAWKDAGSFYGAKSVADLIQWLRVYRGMEALPTAYIGLAPSTGAEYVVSNRPQDRALLAQLGTIVWENATYTLVRL